MNPFSHLFSLGTFTPAYSTSGTPPTGVTYGAQTGWYLKLGKLVIVAGQTTLTSKGAGGTGNSQITDLPFAVGSYGSIFNFIFMGGGLTASSASYTYFGWRFGTSNTVIQLTEHGSNVNAQFVTYANTSNTAFLPFCGFYFTA